jgi:serine/threonine protein kinase
VRDIKRFFDAETGNSYSQLRRAALNEPRPTRPGHEVTGEVSTSHRDALPSGYRLAEFRIEAVLGIGGFGIAYVAYDTLLSMRVAIKEYLPAGLALRDANTPQVYPRASSLEATYENGLQRFLEESRTLANFRHPNIVRVMRFLEANGTAYMVMEYEVGVPLSDWMAGRKADGQGPPDETQFRAMFMPLLDGLHQVHVVGFLHRDIKPANIFVRDRDGSLVLIDFGAARRKPEEDSQAGITTIVTPGYAPLEQYYAHGKQGPWSDLYALGGVWYWLLVGEKPIEAVARTQRDPLKPARNLLEGKYSPTLLGLIDAMLQPDDEKRPVDAQMVLNIMHGLAPLPPIGTGRIRVGEEADDAEPAPRRRTSDATQPRRRASDMGPRKRRASDQAPSPADGDPAEPSSNRRQWAIRAAAAALAAVAGWFATRKP